MAFWANKSYYEPLRQDAWTISFLLKDDTKNTWIQHSLKECSKPEYEIGVTEHRLLTQTFKYPGLLKWKPVNVKLVSTLSEKLSLERMLENNLRSSGYNSPTDYTTDFFTSSVGGIREKIDYEVVKDVKSDKLIVDVPSVSYDLQEEKYSYGNHQLISKLLSSTDVKIQQYNPDGFEVQNWELKNCFISSVSYGKLSYSSEDLVEISLTLQYDYAIEHEVEFYNIASAETAKQKQQKIKDRLEDEAIEKDIKQREQKAYEESERLRAQRALDKSNENDRNRGSTREERIAARKQQREQEAQQSAPPQQTATQAQQSESQPAQPVATQQTEIAPLLIPRQEKPGVTIRTRKVVDQQNVGGGYDPASDTEDIFND